MRKQAFLFLIGAFLCGCNNGGLKRHILPQNMAEFSTRNYEAGEIPANVLKRAANTTRRRGYNYFTLDSKGSDESWQPAVGISYGRNPYGFGDAGNSMPGGLNAGLSVSPPRTNWTIRMFQEQDKPAAQVYDANEILAQP